MHFCLIACVDSRFGIAKDNRLPWSIDEESQHFVKTVTHSPNNRKNAYLVGRVSWELDSPERRQFLAAKCHVIVLSASGSIDLPKDQFGRVCSSFDHALHELMSISEQLDNIFVCGGRRVYREALERGLVRNCIVSRLEQDYQCDVHLPFLPDYLGRYYAKKKNDDLFSEFRIEYWESTPLQRVQPTHGFVERIQCAAVSCEISVSDGRQSDPARRLECPLGHCVQHIITTLFHFCRSRLTSRELAEMCLDSVTAFIRYYFPYARVRAKLTYLRHTLLRDVSLGRGLAEEDKPWGTVDVLLSHPQWNMAMLKISPGKTLPEHYHLEMRETEIVLTGSLQGFRENGPLCRLQAGAVTTWRPGQSHGYHNPSAQDTQYLLAMNDIAFHMEYEHITGRDQLPRALTENVCLVVGGTGGLGSVWANSLVELGYQVIVVARHIRKIHADRCQLFTLSSDLGELMQIDSLLQCLHGARLKALVIASGVKSSPDIRFDVNLWERSFSTNYLGPFYLINKLIDENLIDQHNSRIIILSSCLHDPDSPHKEEPWQVDTAEDLLNHQNRSHFSPHVAYYKSKFALECFVRSLHSRLPECSVVSLNPGYFPGTDIFREQDEAYAKKKVSEQPLFEPSSKREIFRWFLTTKTLHPGAYYDLQQETDPLKTVYIKAVEEFAEKNRLWHDSWKACLRSPRRLELAIGRLGRGIEVSTLNLCGVNRKMSLTKRPLRIEWLLQHIKHTQREIYGFQEVSLPIWQSLRLFCKDNSFYLSPGVYNWEEQNDDHVITATLSKWRPTSFEISSLVTPEDPLNYHFSIGKFEGFSLVNLHLHAGSAYRSLRLKQLKEIADHVSEVVPPNEMLIVMGDFNDDLDDGTTVETYRRELCERLLLRDLWPELHPEDRGYTQNSEVNSMRAKVSGKKSMRRIDGIFCRRSELFEPQKIKLFGDTPIFSEKNKDEYNRIFPSDHFGVCCTFALK